MAQFSWQVSPAFGKFMLCHSLLWKTYISTWGFLLLRKKAKSERVQLVLHWAVTEAVCTPAARSGPTKFLPQEPHSASQHQATRALNCVCEHQCCVLTYFVHSLVRHVLIIFCFTSFWLMKFHRNALLWDSGSNLHSCDMFKNYHPNALTKISDLTTRKAFRFKHAVCCIWDK